MDTMIAKAQLDTIDITQLVPHPQNPRIVVRNDVVDGIAAQLAERGYSEKHAIHVRPIDDGLFQIISGHHRHAAAIKAELAAIPCWVESMSDDDAFMELVRANCQGELSPLERGLHALDFVTLGKAGTEGGLSEYAREIGGTQAQWSMLRSAASVFVSIRHLIEHPEALIKMAYHLNEISKSTPALWPVLVRYLIAKCWSVKDTKHYVERAGEFTVPEQWAGWLPLADVVDRHLEREEFSTGRVKRLVDTAERISGTIDGYAKIDHAGFKAKLNEWLVAGRGGISWDVKNLEAYERTLKVEIEQAEKDASNQWNHGDWRDHIDRLADGSVSLLLTDPPYGIDFQSDRRTDRRQERKHAKIANDGVDEAMQELFDMAVAMFSKMTEASHAFVFCNWRNEPQVRDALAEAGFTVRDYQLIWDKVSHGMGDPATTCAPRHENIVHAVKGPAIWVGKRPESIFTAKKMDSKRHPTEKPVELLKQFIEATTVSGELVADPFGGVASTADAAIQMGRDFWACELDEGFYEIGAERLS